MVTLPFEELGIHTQALYDEPFKAVVPVGHRGEHKKQIDARELDGEKVLLPHAGHCFRQQALTACPKLNRSDAEGLQGNSLETIRQMVASGLGVTVLPCSAHTKKYADKRLIAIDVIRDAIHGLKMPGLSMAPGTHQSAWHLSAFHLGACCAR